LTGPLSWKTHLHLSSISTTLLLPVLCPHRIQAFPTSGERKCSDIRCEKIPKFPVYRSASGAFRPGKKSAPGGASWPWRPADHMAPADPSYKMVLGQIFTVSAIPPSGSVIWTIPESRSVKKCNHWNIGTARLRKWLSVKKLFVGTTLASKAYHVLVFFPFQLFAA